jgi:short subunit dehydrogenase-like uncharacterized protein
VSERPYAIVVFGATGFTGGKTATYLARHAPAGMRWAIAGRSLAKLQARKAELIAIDPRCSELGTLEASVDDFASLQRMAAATQVVLTTVGPFIDYGEPLVRACIEAGTDYVDSTGEPQFVQLVLAKYGAQAASRGVRVVQCCGFDSIPADLGAYFTVRQLPRDQPIQLSGYMSLDARFSGGTEQSTIKAWAAPHAAASAQPEPGPGRSVRLQPGKLEHRKDLRAWCTPLPTVDGPIVLRSAASDPRYGPDFRYTHNAQHASFMVMVLAGLLFGTAALLARFAPLRAILLRMAQRSGSGPSEAQIAKSWFKLRFIAECAGQTVRTEVAGGDPGYGETSKMLAESALCLSQDRASLPARAGVLTPVEAMGELLLERLQRAGLVFRVL